MKEYSQKLLYYLPAFLGLSLSILILWGPLSDPDLWWHVRLGNDIIASKTVPGIETYSWTMRGHPFVDFYWLSEVLMALLLKAFTPIGLSLFFAFIGTLLLFIRIAPGGYFGWRKMLTVLVFCFAFIPVFGVRPVVFSWLFFCLFLALLDRIEQFSIGKVLAYGALLFAIWTNMHDGLVLPLGLLALLIAINVIFWLFSILRQPWMPKPFLSTAAFKKMILLLFVAFLATLITPYGIDLWRTLLHEGASTHNKAFIGEWQGLVIQHQLGFFYFGLSFFTFAFAAANKLWQPYQWIAFFVMFIIGAAGGVHAPFFLLLIAPTTAKAISSIRIPQSAAFYLKIYIVVLSVLAPILFVFFRWQELPKTALLEDTSFPIEAINAVAKMNLQGKMYNEYQWGGYIGYRLPKYQVFIDGRMSSWKRGDTFFIEDYVILEGLRPKFTEVLQKYDPNWFFVNPNIPLVQWLKSNPAYKVVYEDKVAVIIVRKQ